jgi:hypothetical protein
MRVLRDASIDTETSASGASLNDRPLSSRSNRCWTATPGGIDLLRRRSAWRLQGVEKAHRVSHTIETEIRSEIPFVERILIHVEPVSKAVVRIAVPLTDQ